MKPVTPMASAADKPLRNCRFINPLLKCTKDDQLLSGYYRNLGTRRIVQVACGDADPRQKPRLPTSDGKLYIGGIVATAI